MRIVKTFLFFLMITITVSCNQKKIYVQKIGFIENVKVFEGFEMKKDYDIKIQSDLKSEIQILDSLQVLSNKMEIQGNIETFKSVTQEYYKKQEQYNQLFQNLSSKYTSEVNSRLNEYIKDFSNEKEFDVILGSGGEGNVMFIKEKYNVTDELINYINKKYNN